MIKKHMIKNINKLGSAKMLMHGVFTIIFARPTTIFVQPLSLPIIIHLPAKALISLAPALQNSMYIVVQ